MSGTAAMAGALRFAKMDFDDEDDVDFSGSSGGEEEFQSLSISTYPKRLSGENAGADASDAADAQEQTQPNKTTSESVPDKPVTSDTCTSSSQNNSNAKSPLAETSPNLEKAGVDAAATVHKSGVNNQQGQANSDTGSGGNGDADGTATAQNPPKKKKRKPKYRAAPKAHKRKVFFCPRCKAEFTAVRFLSAHAATCKVGEVSKDKVVNRHKGKMGVMMPPTTALIPSGMDRVDRIRFVERLKMDDVARRATEEKEEEAERARMETEDQLSRSVREQWQQDAEVAAAERRQRKLELEKLEQERIANERRKSVAEAQRAAEDAAIAAKMAALQAESDSDSEESPVRQVSADELARRRAQAQAERARRAKLAEEKKRRLEQLRKQREADTAERAAHAKEAREAREAKRRELEEAKRARAEAKKIRMKEQAAKRADMEQRQRRRREEVEAHKEAARQQLVAEQLAKAQAEEAAGLAALADFDAEHHAQTEALKAQMALLENDLAAKGKDTEAYRALQELESELAALEEEHESEGGIDADAIAAREAEAERQLRVRIRELEESAAERDDAGDDESTAKHREEMAQLLKSMEELAARKLAAEKQVSAAKEKRFVAEHIGTTVSSIYGCTRFCTAL